MSAYSSLSKQQLLDIKKTLDHAIADVKSQGLSLDMTRGKPSDAQLDLSSSMLSMSLDGQYISQSGQDCRNYGVLDGIVEAKRLFADFLSVSEAEVFIGGNSSLNMMSDVLSMSMLKGTTQGLPWVKQDTIKFLCPVPGYDRHFALCEHFGIEMIAVPLTDAGPDMDVVEALVKDDAAIKGIWCVPKYSNPTGTSYSDRAVVRLAQMQTAAEDFRVFWDDAYRVHHLTEEAVEVASILEACKQAGHSERVYIFASTSKISMAGSGVALIAGCEANMAFLRQQFSKQTIGYDKLNQLRHVRFFKDMAGIEAHMQRHKQILKPKFDCVDTILSEALACLDIASWTQPKGGYFISLNTLPGCAKLVVSRAAEMGVKLTPAGATYPYGKDDDDKNVRIAPSCPSVEELKTATEILALAIKSVSIEVLLSHQ